MKIKNPDSLRADIFNALRDLCLRDVRFVDCYSCEFREEHLREGNKGTSAVRHLDKPIVIEFTHTTWSPSYHEESIANFCLTFDADAMYVYRVDSVTQCYRFLDYVMYETYRNRMSFAMYVYHKVLVMQESVREGVKA